MPHLTEYGKYNSNGHHCQDGVGRRELGVPEVESIRCRPVKVLTDVGDVDIVCAIGGKTVHPKQQNQDANEVPGSIFPSLEQNTEAALQVFE